MLTAGGPVTNNRGTQMPRGNQLSRQWRLLQLIDRPSGITVEDAAQELACAVRTIWRDLRVLQDAGFPIYDDRAPDGRRGLWKVEEGFKRELPLKLTLAELAALLMSRELLTPLGASVLGPAVQSAFDRIAGVLSRDAHRLLDDMREVIGVRTLGAKLHQPVADHVARIQEALVQRRRLRLRYYAMARDEETRREVDPYHLTYFEGGLYLVAHCHLRQAERVFAVERVRGVEVLPRRFEPPRDFDPRAFLDKAWGILQGDLVTVRVAFTPALARYVRERLWHPSQRLRDLPDGRVELTLRVADTLEVRRWILGFGVQAEVVEPEGLREALGREAEAVAAMLAPRRRPLASAAAGTAGAPAGVPAAPGLAQTRGTTGRRAR
jgi:predicted DNA-binding transcriptional regulator YafY